MASGRTPAHRGEWPVPAGLLDDGDGIGRAAFAEHFPRRRREFPRWRQRWQENPRPGFAHGRLLRQARRRWSAPASLRCLAAPRALWRQSAQTLLSSPPSAIFSAINAALLVHAMFASGQLTRRCVVAAGPVACHSDRWLWARWDSDCRGHSRRPASWPPIASV